jgi:hypothetical protein
MSYPRISAVRFVILAWLNTLKNELTIRNTRETIKLLPLVPLSVPPFEPGQEANQVLDLTEVPTIQKGQHANSHPDLFLGPCQEGRALLHSRDYVQPAPLLGNLDLQVVLWSHMPGYVITNFFLDLHVMRYTNQAMN